MKLTCPQGKYSLNCNKLFNLDKGLKRACVIKSCSRSGTEAHEERCTQIYVVRLTNFRINYNYVFFIFKLSELCLRNSEYIAANSLPNV